MRHWLHPLHETQRQRYTDSDKVVAHRVCIIRNYSNCGSQLSASPTLYPPLFIWYPLLFTIIAMAYHGLSPCCIVCGCLRRCTLGADRFVFRPLIAYSLHFCFSLSSRKPTCSCLAYSLRWLRLPSSASCSMCGAFGLSAKLC